MGFFTVVVCWTSCTFDKCVKNLSNFVHSYPNPLSSTGSDEKKNSFGRAKGLPPNDWYGWWMKSCTTKDDNYPIIYRVLTIPGGAGFQPSTVVLTLKSRFLFWGGWNLRRPKQSRNLVRASVGREGGDCIVEVTPVWYQSARNFGDKHGALVMYFNTINDCDSTWIKKEYYLFGRESMPPTPLAERIMLSLWIDREHGYMIYGVWHGSASRVFDMGSSDLLGWL